jgi:hypothetical protein
VFDEQSDEGSIDVMIGSEAHELQATRKTQWFDFKEWIWKEMSTT